MKESTKPIRYLISAFVILLLFFPDVQNASHADKVIVLVNGTLIDGTGTAPVVNGMVVVKNGIIIDVGARKKIEVPKNAVVCDLKGAAVLPGFINAHVHSGYNEANLRAWARGGVTTVRDLGVRFHDDLFASRDRLLKKKRCARLVSAGPMITVPGGYPKVPWGSPSGLPVTSIIDARNKTDKLIDDGADLIKIAMESGTSFQRKIPVLSPDQAKTVVEAAHARGKIVSAHVLSSDDLERALDAGVDDIAHMVVDELPDRLIDWMVKRGVYWVPTLELWHGVRVSLGRAAVSNLRRFVESGGSVAMGTDYDGYDCEFDLGMPIREVKWMQDAGMTPMQIIVAATKNAAHVCDLGDKIGTLEAGKIADILVVNGNPLDDLDSLLKIRLVIRSGEIIHSEGALR